MTPHVSVSILTYNHRDIVHRALDSVLAQRTNFPIEIIVGDDCSNDGTQDILLKYQRLHPDVIQLILHPRRYRGEIPGRTNNMTNLACCRGKYTAMLDGDDYWTDPDKLQRQYDILESRAEVTMCLHDLAIVPIHEPYSAGNHPTLMDRGAIRRTGIYTHRDLAQHRLSVQISSILFRTRAVDYFPGWFTEIVPADTALMLMLSAKGRVFVDATPRGVYSTSPQGSAQTWFKSETVTQRRIKDIALFAELFPDSAQPIWRQGRFAYLYWRVARTAFKRRQYLSSMKGLLNVLCRDVLYPLKAATRAVKKLWLKQAEPNICPSSLLIESSGGVKEATSLTDVKGKI